MHRLCLTILSVLMLANCGPAPQERTATCDMRQVLLEFRSPAFAPQDRMAWQQTQREMVARESDARNLQRSLAAEIDPAKKQSLQAQLAQLTDEIHAFQTKWQEELRERQMGGLDTMKKAKDAVAQVAKAKGYSRVFDSSGISLAYTDGSDDITQDVLKVVQAMKAEQSQAPSASPTPSPVPSTTQKP